MLTIRTFAHEEWRLYRSLRLDALKESPDAFGSVWEDAIKYPDEEWKARLESVDTRFSCPVLARWGSDPVGLAWGRIEPEFPKRADLYQMWANPDHRGKNVGRGLLDFVLQWARDQGAEIICLGVTMGNISATHLYESAGFEVYGEPEPLRPGSDILTLRMKRVL